MMHGSSRNGAVLAILIGFLLMAAPVAGHEGHDHGDQSSSVSAAASAPAGSTTIGVQPSAGGGGFPSFNGALWLGGLGLLVCGVTVAIVRIVTWAGLA